MRIVIPDDRRQLFTDTAELERLRALGAVAHHTEPAGSREELIARLAEAEIMVTSRSPADFKGADVLDHMPRLRFISNMGTRPRRIDMERVRARGILVSITPGASSTSVAESNIFFVLALAKQFPFIGPAMRAGDWPRRTGVELEGKTISLIGFGHIGRKVARMARGLGMQPLAWSRNMTPERAAEEGARAVSLEACLEADFVTLQLDVAPETRGILSRERIGRMRPTAFLINTARAALADMEALLEALREKRIAGAGLDVFEPDEPLPPDSPYRTLDNVVLTPHCAGDSDGSNLAGVRIAVDNVEAYVKGTPQNLFT